ncbi:MAG: sensor histidine kinase [Flavobacteriales bacterium]
MSKFFSNLKNGILLLTLIFIVGFSSIITYISYKSQVVIFEQETLTRLKAISRTLASQIDGDELEHLYKHYPNKDDITSSSQDSVYLSIHEKLKISAEMNELKTPIYTLMFHPGDKKFHFGVTSAEQPYWMHHFEKYPQKLLDNYETFGAVRPYSDENGTWISAFCAITKSDHATPIGLVQVDMSFDQLSEKALGSLYSNILITLLIVGTLGILIYYSINSLLAQQDQIQETERELAVYRKELIANVSHDLRTPLASIQGYVETLLMPELNLSQEDQNKYLNVTLNSANNLKRLVDELFELSRLESKDRKLKQQSFHIGELAHDILLGLQLDAEQAKISLKHNIKESLPNVTADVALLERVLSNLLSNAIKYCPEGSWIEVNAKQLDNNKLLVAVKDNGIGIPEEQLPELFDRVYRGKNKKSGTGLGLAIVRGILDLHNSSYKAVNNEEGGVTISFTLPISDNLKKS